jgi:hypothetical protein
MAARSRPSRKFGLGMIRAALRRILSPGLFLYILLMLLDLGRLDSRVTPTIIPLS